MPGHVLVWEDGSVTIERYARPAPVVAAAVRKEPVGVLAEELRERLRDSVRAHLVSDVPVGVLLSGGVDSSLLAALAAEETGGPLRTFSIGFEEDSFDVAVIRNLLPSLDPGSRSVTVAEVRRVIRPGGRCIVIDDAPRGGIARLIGGGRGDAGYGQYVQAGGGAGLLQGAGFRGVRTLAEREALVFVEGVKAVLS